MQYYNSDYKMSIIYIYDLEKNSVHSEINRQPNLTIYNEVATRTGLLNTEIS